MGKIVGIIAFLLLAPFFFGFLVGLKAIISARLQEEDPPHVLQKFRDFRLLCREPWNETGHGPKLCAILYLILILIGGSVFFAGGNLAFSILLLVFAQAVKIYTIYHSETIDSALQISEIQRDITSLMVLASQLLLAAAGFYCFTDLFLHVGSFLVADVASIDTAPAFYMPAMLIGFIWLLLYGLYSGFPLRQETGEHNGREKAFFEIGLWYQRVILYAVLFLFNYAGTGLSAVISIAICLLVWLFELLLERPHSQPPEPVVLSAVSAILLIGSFVNLLILLP
jgi:ech hydrogenase subunit B